MNNYLKNLSIFFMGIFALFQVSIAFTFSLIFKALEQNSVEKLIQSVILIAIVIISMYISQFLSTKFRMLYVKKEMILINQKFFEHDITSNKDVDMGSYSSKTDIIVLDYLSSKILIPFNIIMLTFAVLAYMYLSPYYVIYLLFIVAFMMVIPKLTQKKVEKLTEEYTNSSKNYINFLTNIFTGKRELNQYNSVDTYTNKHKKEATILFDKYERRGFFMRHVSISSNFIGTLSFVGLIIMCGVLTITGKSELSMFMTVVQLMNYFVNPIFTLVEDITKYNSIKKQIPDLKEKTKLNKNKPLVIKDKIELKNISYSYDDENVIKYPDIAFIKNKKYLISGKSGTGKSTLAKILSGQIKEYQGQILADGVVNTNDIIYVPQTAHLFFGSVLENITLDRNIDEENVKHAMKLANVSDDLLDKVIDINSEVSGGEKARVSLARSLTELPSIMIIDEPTANLDYKNSIDIIKKLCSIEKLTLIVISHEKEEEFVNCFDEIINL